MPWELTIGRNDGSPLGSRDEVVRLVAEAVPAFTWFEEPPFLERIKDMPDHPFHALIPTWPESVREGFSRSKLYADFESAVYSIRLYGFEGQPINAIHAEIRGDGNPIPVLAALCLPYDWVAVDDGNGRRVEMTSGSATGWESFQNYRDRAILGVKELERQDSAKTDAPADRSQQDDDLTDELLASDPKFQALVAKSKASPRKQFKG